MIVQSTSRQGYANISFTMPKGDLDEAIEVVGSLAKELGCTQPASAPDVAKLSVFGVGIRSHTGVARRMFQSLSAAGINVGMISTSEVRVNVVVDGKHGKQALEVLREEFADAMG